MNNLTSDNLKMISIPTMLVKLTERRVADIRMGELYDLIPKGTSLELKVFKKLIRNSDNMGMEEYHKELGALFSMMIFRIMQEEEENKMKEWDK